MRHDDDAPNECFRAYDSVEESYRDHAEFLEGSPRYDSLFRFDPTDYRSWARGLKGAGYATAPNYTEMLIKIIEDSKLYELDRMASDPRYRTSIIYTPRPVLDRGVGGGGVDPNNFRIAANSSGGYSLYTINSSTYIIAKDGDSYTSVGRSLGLSRKTLLRFNDESDETSSRVLGAGEVIYIERKGKRWVGNLREHMVLEGETLRSISQTYGIRHQSLRRYNHIRQGEEPTIGAKIRLQ